MQIDIDKEVALLQRMTVGQLREKFEETWGEPTNTRNKQWLIKRIAWKLQANIEGDISERARRRAAELARGTDNRSMTSSRLLAVVAWTSHSASAGSQPVRLNPSPLMHQPHSESIQM
ncbi:MAG: DUF2924 domain-containing protein [Pirellula sp.]|nr:DUF2924 domain-containing protein [Pirellula sp.]